MVYLGNNVLPIHYFLEDLLKFYSFKQDRWSPYLVGGLLGLLLFILLNFSRHLGTCPGINRLAFFFSYLIDAKATISSTYFAKMAKDPVILNFKMLFFFSIIIGSYIASKLSYGAPKDTLSIWTTRFGKCPFKRHVMVFVGAIILILGNRIGGGCLAGHAMSGVAQHALTSIIFFVSLLGFGALTAKILYKNQ